MVKFFYSKGGRLIHVKFPRERWWPRCYMRLRYVDGMKRLLIRKSLVLPKDTFLRMEVVLSSITLYLTSLGHYEKLESLQEFCPGFFSPLHNWESLGELLPPILPPLGQVSYWKEKILEIHFLKGILKTILLHNKDPNLHLGLITTENIEAYVNQCLVNNTMSEVSH